MTGRVPPTLLRVFKAALAAFLLVALWRLADGAAALDLLLTADPFWAGAALLALTAQTVLSALRWRLTAAQLGIRLGRRTALREYYLAQIFNQALPGGVLGDAGRAVRARMQAGLLPSAQAVVFERLAGQIALFLVFVAATVPILVVPEGRVLPGWLQGPVIVFGGFGLIALLALWRGEVWPRGMARRIRDPLVHALAAPEVRGRQMSLSLATALLNVASFVLCAEAVGVSLPLVDALIFVPLVLLSMLIPLTIGGWGLRESAAVLILPLAGASSAEALAASVAFGLAILVAALPGLLALRAPTSFETSRP